MEKRETQTNEKRNRIDIVTFAGLLVFASAGLEFLRSAVVFYSSLVSLEKEDGKTPVGKQNGLTDTEGEREKII